MGARRKTSDGELDLSALLWGDVVRDEPGTPIPLEEREHFALADDTPIVEVDEGRSAQQLTARPGVMVSNSPLIEPDDTDHAVWGDVADEQRGGVWETGPFDIEELLDADDIEIEAGEGEAPVLVVALAEPPLSASVLTERLQREVLPRLRNAVALRGYLSLGDLAYAVAMLQGSEAHLSEVRAYVERLSVPIVPSRAHQGVWRIPVETLEDARRRFGDLLRGAPPEHLVIQRLGYAGLALSDGTRAFLMQAWLGHCLSRAEERQHTQVVRAEVDRTGEDPSRWSVEALDAREALILDNLWLVARMARKFVGRGLPLDDLIQSGTLGVMRAVVGNRPELGHRFVTYASNWVFQSIMRDIADKSRLIRLPVHAQERSKAIFDAYDALYERDGRPPTPACIAEAAGVSPSAVHALLVTVRPLSLDRPGRHAWAERRGAVVDYDSESAPESAVEWTLLREHLDAALATLTERERRVIELRFGLDDGQKRTLEEVGQHFGVTRERIRQVEAKALKRLRHPSRTEQLRSYYDARSAEERATATPKRADTARPSETPIATNFSALNAALVCFTPAEQAILVAVFGFDGHKQQSYSRIGRSFNVSRRRIDDLVQRLYELALREEGGRSNEAGGTGGPRVAPATQPPAAPKPGPAVAATVPRAALTHPTVRHNAERVESGTPQSAARMSDPLSHAAQLRPFLRHFSPEEALIADTLFGITTGRPMPSVEVAREFGVSREQVSDVEAAMLFLQASAPAETPTGLPSAGETALAATDVIPAVDAPQVGRELAANEASPTAPPVQALEADTNEVIDVGVPPPMHVWPLVPRFHDPVERRIVDLLAGLSDGNPLTVREVALRLGFPIEEVSRVARMTRILAEARVAATYPPSPEAGSLSALLRIGELKRRAFASFDTGDARLLVLRYGTLNHAPLPAEIVAHALEVPLATVERVSAAFERQLLAASPQDPTPAPRAGRIGRFASAVRSFISRGADTDKG